VLRLSVLAGSAAALVLVGSFLAAILGSPAPARLADRLHQRLRLAVASLGAEAGVVTLAQAKLNATDDIDVNIIDEFRKSSALLDALTFDDAVSPTGGGTLIYGYTRQTSQRAAAFRAINAEYTPTEVTKARYTVELKPLGGSFQIDRVSHRLGRAAAETSFQLAELVKATRTKFADAAINGDTAVDANGFDGLKKALVGSSTELGITDGSVTAGLDWRSATIDTQAEAFAAMEWLDALLDALDSRENVLILANTQGIGRIRALAKWAGYLTPSEDAFGRRVDGYNGIRFVDLGEKAGSSSWIIPTETRDLDLGAGTTNVTGLTDIYAVRLGMDGFHGVAEVNSPLVRTWLPDFTTAGAVKTGEVEMGPVAIALKATKAAAKLTNVKVA
jgi:hypothetical protein